MKITSIALNILLTLSIFGANAMAADPGLVKKTQNDERESLLADSLGKTLYVFDMDKTAGTSACSGKCAELWPPYIITKTEADALVAPYGFITRASSYLQLTYSGRPVYTYIYDRSQGDDKGDGIGGVWHYIQIQ